MGIIAYIGVPAQQFSLLGILCTYFKKKDSEFRNCMPILIQKDLRTLTSHFGEKSLHYAFFHVLLSQWAKCACSQWSMAQIQHSQMDKIWPLAQCSQLKQWFAVMFSTLDLFYLLLCTGWGGVQCEEMSEGTLVQPCTLYILYCRLAHIYPDSPGHHRSCSWVLWVLAFVSFWCSRSLIPRPAPVSVATKPTFLYCKGWKAGQGLGTRPIYLCSFPLVFVMPHHTTAVGFAFIYILWYCSHTLLSACFLLVHFRLLSQATIVPWSHLPAIFRPYRVDEL